VKRGQVLAEITGEDVRVAARTEASRARHESAEQEYEATKSLFEKGLLSESELHRAESTLAEAQLELDRSLLSEARSRLRTPIDGLILRLARDAQGLPMADGQLVAPGFAVAQVAPIEKLVADVDVVGTDVARVAVGMPARVRQHAWEEKRFPGEVIRLAPSLDPVTRSLRAEVEVGNGDGLLRPGMFVEVTLVAEERTEVPVVPRRAVTERGGKRVVFVVNGQRVDRREVVLGLGDDEVVEIREGVDAGERVVVRGLETLTDDTRVRVTSSQ
jgi:RND family efflux transporter MFP subunit